MPLEGGDDGWMWRGALSLGQVRGPAYIRGASSQPQRDIGQGVHSVVGGGHGPGDWGVQGSGWGRGLSLGGGGGVELVGTKACLRSDVVLYRLHVCAFSVVRYLFDRCHGTTEFRTYLSRHPRRRYSTHPCLPGTWDRAACSRSKTPMTATVRREHAHSTRVPGWNACWTTPVKSHHHVVPQACETKQSQVLRVAEWCFPFQTCSRAPDRSSASPPAG